MDVHYTKIEGPAVAIYSRMQTATEIHILIATILYMVEWYTAWMRISSIRVKHSFLIASLCVIFPSNSPLDIMSQFFRALFYTSFWKINMRYLTQSLQFCSRMECECVVPRIYTYTHTKVIPSSYPPEWPESKYLILLPVGSTIPPYLASDLSQRSL